MKLHFYRCWSMGLFLFLLFFQLRAQENLITNGSFANDSGWNLGQYSEGGATGTVNNGSYTISISAPGTVVWAVQFTQTGISLDSAAAYTLSFSISATIERSVEVSLSEDGEPYQSYSGRDTLTLSSQPYQYEKLFVMKQPSDTNVRLEFNCGEDTGSVSVSDVRLVRYTEKILTVERPSAGEIIYAGIPYTISWLSINVSGDVTIELSGDNGSNWTTLGTVRVDTGAYTWVPEATFSPWCRVRLKSAGDGEVVAVSDGRFELAPKLNLVKNGFFTDEQYWNIDVYAGTASGSVSGDGKYHIQIDTAAPEYWQIQLTQIGVNLIREQQYQFSFIAYSDTATDMQINIGMDHEPYASYFDTTQWNVTLTAEPKRYTFLFTMNAESDSSARIEFNCGTATDDIFIDEVYLAEEYVAPVTTSAGLRDRTVSVKTQQQIVFGNHPRGTSLFSATGNRKSGRYIIDLKGRRVGSVSSRLTESIKVVPMAPGMYLFQPVKVRTP